MPDANPMSKCRRRRNDSKPGESIFANVGAELQACGGFKVDTVTIVDATIIGPPSSTKNADKARDPDSGGRQQVSDQSSRHPHLAFFGGPCRPSLDTSINCAVTRMRLPA